MRQERGTIRIHVLGGFSVERDGVPIPGRSWERPIAKTLIKLLAIEPSHHLHREQILDRLWPDQPPDAAVQTLRKALTWTRNALEPERARWGPSCYLVLDREMVCLDPAHIWIDVDSFERAATAAIAAGEVRALADVLSLYTGELLPEDRYADWAAARRQQMADLRDRLILAYARACEEAGRYEDALEARSRLAQSSGDPDSTGTTLPPAVLRHLPDVPLLGRERVMGLLAGALEGLASGAGTAVVISGEAGVGKTRLAAELAREAATTGATVLWGQCYHQEGTVAYGPMIDAIEGYLGALEPSVVDDFAVRYPSLRALLPSLGRIENPAPAPRAVNPSVALTEQTRLFAALAGLMVDISREGPLVLMLDDLHAADPAALELLNHLLHTCQDRSMLVLATYRREDAPEGGALHRILASAQREGLVRTVGLLRLSRDDADRLARVLLPDGVLAPDVVGRIWELSLGNPLYIRELVQTMRSEQMLVSVGGRWEMRAETEVAVPRTIRDMVGMRIAHRPSNAADVLNLAAVHGMEISYRLLRRASVLDDECLLDALDSALEGRILEERDDDYAFRHPLLRQALLESLSTARHAYLNGRLALALEQEQPDEVERLAYHFDRSGEDAKAVEYLERAGDRAKEVYAHADAEALYRRLLVRLDRAGRQTDAARAREKLGVVLATQARYDEALELFEEAARVQQRAEDWERVGELAVHVGYVHAQRGTLAEGIQRTANLLSMLADVAQPAAVARLQACQVNFLYDLARYGECLTLAARVAEQARAASDDATLALMEIFRGAAIAVRGQAQEGITVVVAGVELARRIDDADSLSQGLLFLGTGAMLVGSIEKAHDLFQEMVAVADRTGDPARAGLARAYRGITRFYLGRWNEAVPDLIRSVEITGPLTSRYSSFPLARMAEVRLAGGEWEEAEADARRAIGVGAEGNRIGRQLAHRVLAEHEILTGWPQRAVARLTPLVGAPQFEQQLATPFLATLAWAYLECGDVQRANSTALDAVQRAATGFRRYCSDAQRVLGMARMAQHRYDAAGVALNEAIATAREIRCPYDEARALHARAELAIAQDDAYAASLLQQAATIYRRLGARPALGQAEQALCGLRGA